MPFLCGYRSYRKVLLHSPGQTLDEGLSIIFPGRATG
jgi:hypothetical protein